MEIVNANSASMCNYEVMVHLQKLKDTKTKQTGQLATITYETLRYLEGLPHSKINSKNIVDCIAALQPYNLTKNEVLMIVNNPPTTLLEMQFIAEENQDRLTDTQVNEILKICEEHLKVVLKTKVTEEEEDAEEQDESET